MNQKKIGSFIKELRQSHSLTQEELAQILSCYGNKNRKR